MTDTTVAVLGLGPMGSAIARAISARGHRVRAWNRTAKTFPELGLEHSAVELRDSPQEALDGADLIVLCVRDHNASRDVLGQIALS
ncbi:NAD(P)-binding domain-containing protein [Rhodococcoides fascians]|uniref:NAD(P)-binding domain-containing protein n=1 Tax=Rhodococcoides fascians TaxID=1828 RepID=UPI00056B94E2|nr:NAD(P)-binding domain-containing protein [Rhodococcus fascians]